MKHLDDEFLAELALDPESPVDPDLAEHLAACELCRDQLHSLRRTRQFVATADPNAFTAPPPRVWAAISEAMETDAEPTAPTLLQPRRRARSGGPWLLAAAAAVVGIVLGALGGRMLWAPATQPSGEVLLATASLNTLDSGIQEGTAELVDTLDGVELRVTTQPLANPDGYLEVWLINTDGKRMVAVGQLADGISGVFSVPQSVIDNGYVIVDISREALDDQPQHSGDSVVRGKLSL
ncbi:MAG: anti-sigma factor [Propionibacteriaceae bacterium]|nr:anti-sigma factor [Propionibacteriaceae bacterium]